MAATYLCKRTRLVGADDGHCAQGFHRFERFAQYHGLAHQSGSDGKARGQCDRKFLRNKGNGDTDAVDNKRGNVDVVRMRFPQSACPAKIVISSPSTKKVIELTRQ